MSDSIGSLALPLAAGDFHRRLDVLLAFCKAVLIAQAQTAWASAAPLEPQQIVASTFAEHPRLNPFIEARELPALFAFESKGKFNDITAGMGDGYERVTSTISLWWLFPPAQKENEQDPVPAGVARVLAMALSDARHPAYVHADDVAAPEAVRLAATAPAADTVYSGAALDGVLGGGEWPTPGRVLITTGAGTWDTGQPITITTIREDGVERSEDVYLTSAVGPETIAASWIGTRVVSIAVPGGNVGEISFGRALAPAAEYGSSLRQYMDCHYLRLVSWNRPEGGLVIPMGDGGRSMTFDGVLMEIEVQETRDRTADALGYADLPNDGFRGRLTSMSGGVSAEVYE